MREVRFAILVRAVLFGIALSIWAGEHVRTAAQAAPKSIKEQIPADGEDIPIEGDGAAFPSSQMLKSQLKRGLFRQHRVPRLQLPSRPI